MPDRLVNITSYATRIDKGFLQAISRSFEEPRTPRWAWGWDDRMGVGMLLDAVREDEVS